MFNEIFSLIFEKNKKMEPFERSTLQLMTILQRNQTTEAINSFPYCSKTHSTLGEKKFIPLYAENLFNLKSRLVNHPYI